MKIIISEFGGFHLSPKAIKEYLKLKGKEVYFYFAEKKEDDVYFRKTDENTETLFVYCFTKDMGDSFKASDISDKDWKEYNFSLTEENRTDKDLIKVVEKLGEKANTEISMLKIIEIPDDVEWIIEQHDGNEWVSEKHKIWN